MGKRKEQRRIYAYAYRWRTDRSPPSPCPSRSGNRSRNVRFLLENCAACSARDQKRGRARVSCGSRNRRDKCKDRARELRASSISEFQSGLLWLLSVSQRSIRKCASSPVGAFRSTFAPSLRLAIKRTGILVPKIQPPKNNRKGESNTVTVRTNYR